jgi:hypothetical protein
MLCCALYDSETFGVGNFLTTPVEELQGRKQSSDICERCTKHGSHVWGMYAIPELHVVAIKSILDHYAGQLNATPAFGQPADLRRTLG